MEGFIWSRNPRWITGRNVLQFTKILMEKEDQFLYIRTFGIRNKIGYHVLTHLEEYKYSANSKHPYDSTLKGNGGIPTIKHTPKQSYTLLVSQCLWVPKYRVQEPHGSDEIIVYAGVPWGWEIFCPFPHIPQSLPLLFDGLASPSLHVNDCFCGKKSHMIHVTKDHLLDFR